MSEQQGERPGLQENSVEELKIQERKVRELEAWLNEESLGEAEARLGAAGQAIAGQVRVPAAVSAAPLPGEPEAAEQEEPTAEAKAALREALRRAELLRTIQTEFKVVDDSHYYYKDHHQALAFKDTGSKLVTSQTDEKVAFAMAAMAVAKGWAALKVSGHPDFRRAVWFEASLRGVAVKGYTPTERELQDLQERRERGMQNMVERADAPERAARAERPAAAPENTSPTTQETRPEPQPRRAEPHASDQEKDRAERVVSHSGILLDHGPAPYQHNPQEKPSYFVTLQNDGKKPKTIWGLDLARAIAVAGVSKGDAIRLEKQGAKPVTVEANLRDQTGTVIGQQTIDSHRNQWQVERMQVVKAVAEQVVQEKITNPEVQQLVLGRIDQRLAERAEQGRLPGVMVFDKNAPPKENAPPARPQVERSERAR